MKRHPSGREYDERRRQVRTKLERRPRIDAERNGILAEIYREFNELAGLNEKMAREIVRVGRIVGREGGNEALHFFTEPKNVCIAK